MGLTLCDIINSCINYNCENQSVAGVQEQTIIYNLSDVSFTFGLDPTQITAITPSVGKQGYLFSGTSKSFSYESAGEINDFGTSQYTHKFNGQIISVNNDTTDIVRRLANSTMVAVTFGRNGVINVWGVKSGLRTAPMVSSMDKNATWTVEMSSLDPQFEVFPAYTYIGGGGTFVAERDLLIATITCP